LASATAAAPLDASERKAGVDHVRLYIASTVDLLSTAKREDVLKFCAQEKLFAPPILGEATLAAIAGHVVEVCQEWRWM
jgi:hypothetical protein